MLMRLALAATLCFCLLVVAEEEYPEGVESDEEAEEEEEGGDDGGGQKPRKSLARPRRLSELSTKTTIHPLPLGSAFFLFSHTNRYAKRTACSRANLFFVFCFSLFLCLHPPSPSHPRVRVPTKHTQTFQTINTAKTSWTRSWTRRRASRRKRSWRRTPTRRSSRRCQNGGRRPLRAPTRSNLFRPRRPSSFSGSTTGSGLIFR
jgi:hypothetical protein